MKKKKLYFFHFFFVFSIQQEPFGKKLHILRPTKTEQKKEEKERDSHIYNPFFDFDFFPFSQSWIYIIYSRKSKKKKIESWMNLFFEGNSSPSLYYEMNGLEMKMNEWEISLKK